MIKPYLYFPKPTAGHHFSDYLTCPLRAWLHYYGNPKDQVDDPAYLKALFHEGLNYEREIYAEYYPDAFKVPAIKDKAKREEITIDAMRDGIPIILQGYLYGEDNVGVLDFLELICETQKSSTGFLYRVGEIKSSARLYTSQILQAYWYTELLLKVQNCKINEVNFITKGQGQQIIQLDNFDNEFFLIKQALFALRESHSPPEPYLVQNCKSCHWRGICMKELIESKHISLIPGISKTRAKILKTLGVHNWKDLSKVPNKLLKETGFLPYEIKQIQHSIKCLENNKPPLHYPLKNDVFNRSCVTVLEFPHLAAQREAGLLPTPTKIYYETDRNKIAVINIIKDGEKLTADLSPLTNGQKLVFYGSTDSGAFFRLGRENGYKFRNYFDLFDLVDKFVHVPTPGIELDVLLGYITNAHYDNLTSEERVRAIREVIHWISRSI